jgi:hypothetical protein
VPSATRRSGSMWRSKPCFFISCVLAFCFLRNPPEESHYFLQGRCCAAETAQAQEGWREFWLCHGVKDARGRRASRRGYGLLSSRGCAPRGVGARGGGNVARKARGLPCKAAGGGG